MSSLSSFSDRLYRETLGFCPPGCWLYKVANLPGSLPEIDEAMRLVDEYGQLERLFAKASIQHRNHAGQSDLRVIDCISEAVCFAYAACSQPMEAFCFTDDVGKPDIESPNVSLEVKTIHRPVDRRDVGSASGTKHPRSTEGREKKLRLRLESALAQTSGRMRQQMIALNVLGFEDEENDIFHEDNMESLRPHAASWLKGHPEVSEVVLIWNFEWLSPKVVRFLAA